MIIQILRMTHATWASSVVQAAYDLALFLSMVGYNRSKPDLAYLSLM